MRPLDLREGKNARGMTLIELMIVIAIIAVATSGVLVSFRQVARTTARSAAAKLSAGIRYVYDQSVVTGKYYRLAIDLDKGSYKVERSDDRFYLVAEKERAPGNGRAFDADAETKMLDEEEAKERDNTRGIAKQLQPPPQLKRAHFQSFQDAMLPTVQMKGAWIRDVYTPRQREPYSEGKAYLYFFPDGHTEQAALHIVSGKRPAEDQPMPKPEDVDVYTLFVHPLTGRVEMKNGDQEVRRDFDQTDEEGQTERGR